MIETRYFVSAVHKNTRHLLAGPFHTYDQANDALDRLSGFTPCTLTESPATCQHRMKFNYTFVLTISKRLETDLSWFGNMIEQHGQEGLF